MDVIARSRWLDAHPTLALISLAVVEVVLGLACSSQRWGNRGIGFLGVIMLVWIAVAFWFGFQWERRVVPDVQTYHRFVFALAPFFGGWVATLTGSTVVLGWLGTAASIGLAIRAVYVRPR